MTVTFVWRTDVHLADKAPRSRTDDWAKTVLGKLRQVGEIAREVGANAVLDGGDFYHIKTPNRTTHALTQRVAEVHAAYPCPVYAVHNGNHDVKYGDGAYLNEAPLGVLFATGVFKMLDDVVFGQVEESHRCFPIGENITELLPKEECPAPTVVRIVGIPYHGKTYDMNRLTTIVKGDEDYLVVCAHLLASRAGGEMFGSEDIVRYSDLVNLDPDVWCFSHWHKNQGVAQLGSKHIVNIGSLTRGALNEDDTSRIPEVAILRFSNEGITIERRELEVGTVAEVFDLERRAAHQASEMTVDAFVDSVKKTLQAEDRPPLLDEIRSMDLPEPVVERAVLYIEAEGAI